MRESFTNLEKEILNRVNNTKEHYALFPNLIDDYLKNVSVKINVNNVAGNVIFLYDSKIIDINDINHVQEIIDNCISFFIEVIGILELFEKEGYIYVYRNSTYNPEFSIGEAPENSGDMEYNIIDLALQKKIVRFAISEIYRTPALKEFIENKFKTSDTVRFEKSLKYAELGIIVAIIIGLSSLVIGVLGIYH